MKKRPRLLRAVKKGCSNKEKANEQKIITYNPLKINLKVTKKYG